MFDDIMNATVYSTIIDNCFDLLFIIFVNATQHRKHQKIFNLQMFPLYVSFTRILDAFMYGLNAEYVLSGFSAA